MSEKPLLKKILSLNQVLKKYHPENRIYNKLLCHAYFKNGRAKLVFKPRCGSEPLKYVVIDPTLAGRGMDGLVETLPLVQVHVEDKSSCVIVTRFSPSPEAREKRKRGDMVLFVLELHRDRKNGVGIHGVRIPEYVPAFKVREWDSTAVLAYPIRKLNEDTPLLDLNVFKNGVCYPAILTTSLKLITIIPTS